jgi:hypothetical protein
MRLGFGEFSAHCTDWPQLLRTRQRFVLTRNEGIWKKKEMPLEIKVILSLL